MRRSKRTEVLSKSSGQHLKDHNIGPELTSAWKSLDQSKAALRHIENKLEAGPGAGVLLECIMDPTKKKSSKYRCRDGDQDSSKKKGRRHHSPEKSTSRSPLRNCNQNNTVRNSVEFRDPLASYREATPPPHPSSPPDLQSVPGSSLLSLPSNSNPVLSHLVYQSDTRDKQTDRDLDSTRSSALESMEVRYLNDQPALDTLRTNLSHAREATQTDGHLKAQPSMDNKESTSSSIRRGESTPSSSPGSASQRLENLRRHQPDDKLEKLKERIRKQRQHLEEAAEKNRPCYLEQPITENGKSGTSNIPKVRVRKVATAPPAPVYKGFNGTETKIQTPDGKIWNEADFHNFSREIYKDLSRQFAETTKSQLQKEQRDLSKERKCHKPVRKVQKVGPVSDLNAKPVINPASWREGQKLVNMVLGPVPRVTNEESQTTKGQSQKASSHRSSSGPCSKSNRPAHTQSTERKEIHNRATISEVKDGAPLPLSKDMLSADIQGILDDLQLDCKTSESPERARPRSRRGTGGRRGRGSGSRTRDPVSVWGTTAATRVCRSVSPTSRTKAATAVESGQKRRHYDADTVRQYIAQQQEKRKRCRAEEKKALREEAEKRNQRLQELYRKQREVAKSNEVSVGPAQQRLQETFNKLLLEGSQQLRPMYQPSGESDKENKRLDPSQSPSSSDRSLNNPPLARTDLDYRDTSSAHFEHVSPDVHPKTNPSCSNEHLLSQLLRLETALAASERQTQRPATAPNLSPAKMSRIEALKATATSLSNRIESEARKLAGEGLNYGLTTAVDVDTILAPRSSHSPSHRDGRHAQQSSYSGTGLPGIDAMNSFKGRKQKNTSHLTHPPTTSAQQPIPSHSHDRGGLVKSTDINERLDKIRQKKYAKHADHHDTSSGSISEGPLSEGSLSDCEPSPARPTNVFTPIGHREAVQHSAKKSHQRLSQFQKEAEKFSAINSVLSHQETPKPAWEEFNKGSPLSVINIFTKNLQENVIVSDRSLERDTPYAHSLPSGNKAELYESDFVSTHSSGASGQIDSAASSCVSNHFEEMLRRSTEKNLGCNNSHHTSVQSPRSFGSTSHSSPHSHSSTKKGVSDHSDATLVEEPNGSPASEQQSSASKKRVSVHGHTTEGLSHQSSEMDKNISPPCKLRLSPPVEVNSSSVPLRNSSPERGASAGNTVFSGLAECRAFGELQYSPAVLQQRLAADLHYLDSIEESVRQLGDIERLMGVSMAQHEKASLAQMLKAKQQQHEHELYELKIKTEREALETRLQMEENRQRVAQAHIDLQENLAVTQKDALEGLQEATTKMMSQQAEAAQYTADTARHIKEMTEMAHAQLTTLKHPSVPHTSSDTLKQKLGSHEKCTDRATMKSRRTRSDEPHSAYSSYSHSDSVSFRSSELSGTSSHNHSPANVSSEFKETAGGKRKQLPSKDKMDRDEGSTSIEDEAPIAANDSLCSDSIPSAVEEKGDTTSVATEYSLKFEESITEDEIEERSFRSLLPSEAHRRESLDKKLRHHDESEEDRASHSNTSISVPQDVNTAFSGGQDSFSQFTMEMVRQYMKDEEVRLQHQSSLLHLRQKALKEKTQTELAWLEHQKKKLRDKGEDDKMPPIRKKQRGLLLKLQQEQAEIKRLQEANKAARKERLLLLKQQEEIERMRSSTFKLKERLRCAASQAPSETSLSEAFSSNLRDTDRDGRSPSPSVVSVSGSETSSIMQKLKKMRSQMDEKFLTKREQQLMQRRHHAEELLQWKQRLDQEEAEVRKIEKRALSVWDRQNMGHDISESEKNTTTSPGQREKDFTSEVSSVTPESSIHTDVGVQDESPEVAKVTPASEIASIQSSPANYTDEFSSVSPSPNRQTSTMKSSPSDENRKTVQNHSVHQMPQKESTDSHLTKQTEPISDQSDIESRIRALKEELKKRKFTAYQLKKEQKKRNKERLKAQEANLLKQLETYNDLIEKTTAELNTAAENKSQIKDLVLSAECPSDELPSHRSSYRKISEPESIPVLHHKDVTDLPDRCGSTSAPLVFSDEDPPTVAPTPRQGSPECLTSGQRTQQSIDAHLQAASRPQKNDPGLENLILEPGSEVQEEVKSPTSQKAEDQSSECLLKLDKHKKMEPALEPSSMLDRQLDTQESSEAKNSVKSFVPIDKSVTADIKADPVISSVMHSDLETPSGGGYHDDFESSVDSSLREQDSSKPAAETRVNHSEEKKNIPTWNESHDEEIEEEIAEEVSELSEASDGSQNYKMILDVNDKAQPAKPQNSVNSSHSPPLTPKMSCTTPVLDEMPVFNIGDRVVVSGVQPGTLRFKGPTSFANGFWAGVELDKSEGSNNGTYDGVLYFECAENHGIFAPPDKITHLTDKFEIYNDTTEDDDSFFDDMSDNEKEDRKTEENKPQTQHLGNQVFHKDSGAGDNKATDDLVQMDNSLFKAKNQEDSKHPVINGKSIWDSGDVSPTPLIEDSEKTCSHKKTKTGITNVESHIDLNHHVSPDIKNDDVLQDKLGSLADKLLNNFVKDTVQQFAEIKKAKAKKITAADHMNGNVFEGVEKEEWVHQKDDLPFFLTQEKEELSSPELCNRPESPVLGASGQEELAKRLAELELSRELLDDIGDDQDWFDEDYGLSSRREQQRIKQKQRQEEEQVKGILGKTGSAAGAVIGGLLHPPSGEQQVKTPPRPELPLPMPPKLPEEPAMVVPHSATEIEKMVHAATLEIWRTCGLGEEGSVTLPLHQKPNPSREYLGEEPHSDDQEAVCIHSYRKAVYDLTWEILQDIYAEDPNAYQPQWVKPQRARSSSFQKVRTPGDVTRIQNFISTEVLKLYGLTKDQNHKTDWPKMLKFGRKKRDRVDNVLVQELHEEEAQWVNYDEDELFVKIQLADSIFEALLKDTANVLTQVYDKRAKGDGFS